MAAEGDGGAGHTPYDVFISYSHLDDEETGFARDLAEWLEEQGFKVWWDRSMLVGDDWHEQITKQLVAARKVVALWSKRSLSREFCIDEAKTASGLGKLLPIDIEPLSEDDFPPTLLKLVYRLNRIYLHADEAPGQLLKALDIKPSMVSAATTAQQADPARISIAALPTGAGRLIGRDIELTRLNGAWASTAPEAAQDLKTNVVVLHAIGGAGKTALMRKFVNDLAAKGFPGAGKVFGWSAYSQGSGEDRNIDADKFLSDALAHFGHDFNAEPLGNSLDKGRALARIVAAGRNLLIIDGLEPLQHPPHAVSAADKTNKDVVQRSGGIKDKGVAVLVKELAAANKGLLLITSRQNVVELEDCEAPRVVSTKLEQLDDKAGATLLRDLGVWGEQADLEATSRTVEGHALSLSLLATYLNAVHAGDVRRRDHFDFAAAIANAASEGDRKAKRAQHVMNKYIERLGELQGTASGGRMEIMILRLVGLFDRPADRDALTAVLAEPVIEGLTEAWHEATAEQRVSRWGWAVRRLRDLKLLNAEDPHAPGEIDAHPVVREHFAREVASGMPAAWREAHSRLFNFYRYRDLPEDWCNPISYAVLAIAASFPQNIQSNMQTLAAGLSPRGSIPPTLQACSPDERMQAAEEFKRDDFRTVIHQFRPDDEAGILTCYAAIGHACKANRHAEAYAEVYVPRVSRGNEYYATKRLGLYGAELAAIAGFFDEPFSTPSANLNEQARALMLNLAGSYLRALGRLAEAVEPMRLGSSLQATLDDYHNAASGGSDSTVSSGLARKHLNEAVARLIASNNEDHIPRGLIARATFLRWSFETTRNRADLAGASDDLRDAEAIARQDERNGGAMRLFLTDIALERCRLALAQLPAVTSAGDPRRQKPTMWSRFFGSKTAGEVEPPSLAALPDAPSPAALLALADRHWQAAATLIKQTGYHRRDKDLAALRSAIDRPALRN